jgi:hypothetical protein
MPEMDDIAFNANYLRHTFFNMVSIVITASCGKSEMKRAISGQSGTLGYAMQGKTSNMSDDALKQSAAALRAEADRLIAALREEAANDGADELQDVLELRYGSGFAQWMVDRLPSTAQI